MKQVVPQALAAGMVLSFFWSGCLLPTSSSDSSPPPECTTDTDCASTPSCREWRCEAHQCQEHDLADGVAAPDYAGNQPVCQRVVCDGQGETRTEPDPTNTHGTSTPSCKKATCDGSGNVSYEPDPSNTPADTPHDCQVDQCASDGSITQAPDPTDLPEDHTGDCSKPGCDASGAVTKTPDDSDTPPDSTCFSYTCSGGKPVGTPINPTTNCSSEGYVCGSDGLCSTCPAPDAACTDPGPGSRDASSAHDFGGIGRTDTGGRRFCGAVPNGAAEYYTYYDNETGFLAKFDPYFEIRPQAQATMCVYFDCPSINCPSGWSDDTMSGHPGCCEQAAPGSFSGARIDFCASARVDIKVTTQASCAGYEVHFHD